MTCSGIPKGDVKVPQCMCAAGAEENAAQSLQVGASMLQNGPRGPFWRVHRPSFGGPPPTAFGNERAAGHLQQPCDNFCFLRQQNIPQPGSLILWRLISPPRGALEGKGIPRGAQKRLNRGLQEVAKKAVGGGYCRLQMPLKLALGVRETVAGHRLGALEEGGVPPPSNAPPPPPLINCCMDVCPQLHNLTMPRANTILQCAVVK